MADAITEDLVHSNRQLAAALTKHAQIMRAGMRQTWDMDALKDRYRGVGEKRIRALIHKHRLQAVTGRGINICLNLEDVLQLDRILRIERDEVAEAVHGQEAMG